MKLDLLVVAAHPDDAEISAAGLLLKSIAQGKKVGVLDLTQGELGTRGSLEIRAAEAARASEILGLHVRANLRFQDARFNNDDVHRRELVRAFRRYQPEVIVANAPEDRHPDHSRAARLVQEAWFYSGLAKYETFLEDGAPQAAFRPRRVFHYIQDQYIQPTFVVDISPYFEQKMLAIKAFSSQFYNPESEEPETHISTNRFMHFLEARARTMGHFIGVEYGEGFIYHQPLDGEAFFSL